ncbi:MAG: hypothetical protein CMB80_26365 [Flammeovirgaceae bacterium]|nr:hypothetical protein [Flammeovirgaceae bacterium]MBE63175.1 hypothetical protein [Flammeovirgaceae bacterium]
MVAAYGQSDQAEFLEAKRLLSEGKYSSAKASFGALSQSEAFGKYAQFYYAISAYKQGDTKQATDAWKQLISQTPDWPQRSEVLYWLAYSGFESGEYDQGLNYASQYAKSIDDEDAESLFIQSYLSELSPADLNLLVESYPENKVLASLLLEKLNAEPYQERNFLRVNQLVDKWNFDISKFESVDLPLIRKDTYDIAILLPFLFESLNNTNLISQNRLVMDMYQGMIMAAEDLAAIERPVNLFPYDTKKTKEATDAITKKPGFKDQDLIVGPLYGGPREVIDTYSKEQGINTINPISNNAEIINENPYAFLLKPSFRTMAIKTAELALSENTNPYAMIFYEQNERDSTFAAIYKERIEQGGMEVVLYQAINKDNAKALLDTLAATYYSYLTEEEADSISMIPGRFVKDRRIRNDELKRMEKDTSFVLPISMDEDEEFKIVYYEEPFYMTQDSIGHILAATRSNLYANNMISTVESRRDSTKLYGYGDWLEFTMLSFSQLDRLGVALNDPEYIDFSGFNYQNLKERIITRFKTNPSINHYRGYEAIWFAGRMMHRYGKYFQVGLREGNLIEGKVFEGYKYGVTNDNQVVPVVRFKNSKLEVVNRDLYED